MDANLQGCQPSFEAERWIIAPHGKSAIVRLAQAISDAAIFANREVVVDGCTYFCSRMDTAAHAPPFRAGEYITLLVEAPE